MGRPAPQFLFEATGRALASTGGSWGVDLFGEHRRSGAVSVRPFHRLLTVTVRGAQRAFPLPESFDPMADHLLRVEVDGGRLTVMVDTIASRFRVKLPFEPYGVALFADGLPAAFAAPEITLGWEELFDGPESTPHDLDWDADAGWSISAGELTSPKRPGETLVAKTTPAETYEFVVNIRVAERRRTRRIRALSGGLCRRARSASQRSPPDRAQRRERLDVGGCGRRWFPAADVFTGWIRRAPVAAMALPRPPLRGDRGVGGREPWHFAACGRGNARRRRRKQRRSCARHGAGDRVSGVARGALATAARPSQFPFLNAPTP